MAFPAEIAEQALLSCGRFCCLCHRFCGNKIETHHIEQCGDNTFDNCIPLCFDCHAEVGSYNLAHPKGRKFTPSELKGHRDRWYQLVKDGKHFEMGKSLPIERVLIKADLKRVEPGGRLVIALELVNSGGCPLYIKEVSLGWHFLGEPKTTYTIVHFTSGEHWKCPLPAGMSREYQASIGPILFSRGTKSLHFDDVWISVETPKGEIQRMVELQGLILFSSLLLPRATMHGTGRHLYPT